MDLDLVIFEYKKLGIWTTAEFFESWEESIAYSYEWNFEKLKTITSADIKLWNDDAKFFSDIFLNESPNTLIECRLSVLDSDQAYVVFFEGVADFTKGLINDGVAGDIIGGFSFSFDILETRKISKFIENFDINIDVFKAPNPPTLDHLAIIPNRNPQAVKNVFIDKIEGDPYLGVGQTFKLLTNYSQVPLKNSFAFTQHPYSGNNGFYPENSDPNKVSTANKSGYFIKIFDTFSDESYLSIFKDISKNYTNDGSILETNKPTNAISLFKFTCDFGGSTGDDTIGLTYELNFIDELSQKQRVFRLYLYDGDFQLFNEGEWWFNPDTNNIGFSGFNFYAYSNREIKFNNTLQISRNKEYSLEVFGSNSYAGSTGRFTIDCDFYLERSGVSNLTNCRVWTPSFRNTFEACLKNAGADKFIYQDAKFFDDLQLINSSMIAKGRFYGTGETLDLSNISERTPARPQEPNLKTSIKELMQTLVRLFGYSFVLNEINGLLTITVLKISEILNIKSNLVLKRYTDEKISFEAGMFNKQINLGYKFKPEKSDSLFEAGIEYDYTSDNRISTKVDLVAKIRKDSGNLSKDIKQAIINQKNQDTEGEQGDNSINSIIQFEIVDGTKVAIISSLEENANAGIANLSPDYDLKELLKKEVLLRLIATYNNRGNELNFSGSNQLTGTDARNGEKMALTQIPVKKPFFKPFEKSAKIVGTPELLKILCSNVYAGTFTLDNKQVFLTKVKYIVKDNILESTYFELDK